MSLPAADVILVTPEGYERLYSDLEALSSEGRRTISERLQEARDDGHLDDNPALFDALREQADLERRIATLELQLSAARIATPNVDGTVGIGSAVQLRDLATREVVEYQIVGEIEADARQGRLSVDAPVGRALLGAAAGDIVTAACPRGHLRLEVISVAAAEDPARKAA